MKTIWSSTSMSTRIKETLSETSPRSQIMGAQPKRDEILRIARYDISEYPLTIPIMTIQEQINQLPDSEKEQLSDWYHTFKELYNHRVTLFVALCNSINDHANQISAITNCWKSKLHADWTMWDWWFIAWIWTKKWDTLTYHLPIEEWNNLTSPEIKNAPEWDGHTSDDVLRMLKNL